jgi:ubiquinone biosynthesis protein
MKEVIAAREAAASGAPRIGRGAIVRFAEIAAICAVHGLRGAIRRLMSPRGASRAGEDLANLFERLGPAFVKLGQILSSRPDLLPPRIAGPLARLQQDLSPAPPPDARAAVERSLGCDLASIFQSFDASAIASGSIADVYRAVLNDGRRVAVKVRRPGVAARIATDIHLLEVIARLFDRLPGTAAIPFTELVAQLSAPLREQVDFRLEAENNRRFRRNFRGVERVVMPRLVDDLCTESVLTMEYVADLRKLSASELDPAEARIAALTGLRALYKMIFVDGLVHADLHQANIFAGRFGSIVLLDMGLVAHVSAAERKRFATFFIGLVTNNAAACSQVLVEMAAWSSPRFERTRFDAQIARLVAAHWALPSRDFEVARFVLELMEIQRRSGLRGSTAFIMIVLSMVVYDGICKQLYPECDFQAEARGFLVVAAFTRSGEDDDSHEPTSARMAVRSA